VAAGQGIESLRVKFPAPWGENFRHVHWLFDTQPLAAWSFISPEVTQATRRLCRAIVAAQPTTPVKFILMSSVSVNQPAGRDAHRGAFEKGVVRSVAGIVGRTSGLASHSGASAGVRDTLEDSDCADLRVPHLEAGAGS
jgi:hypothetical protein